MTVTGLARVVAAVLAAAGAVAAFSLPASAAPALTATPITWNVIGLDSNDVSAGPSTYPVGGRVCNGGDQSATGAAATLAWTSESAVFAVDGPLTQQLGTVAAGTCRDVYWTVGVERNVSSYTARRSYEIRVTSAEGAAATTPTPRELYVEQLISQNRNSVNEISGPTSVVVGDVVTFTVDANTATNGYEQLESFLTLPPSMFELLETSVTYGAPPGATNNTMYADACGWDNVPTSPTYLTCIGPENFTGGKAGGALLATYRVRVIGAGTATLSAAIYDKSGSSYHYNSDFGAAPNLLVVTASQPAPPTTTTTLAPGAPGSGATSSTTVPSTAGASTPTTAAPATRTARGGLADTGASSWPLTLLGLSLVVLGSTALGTTRREAPIAATALERSIHGLREALYANEHDAVTARAWRLLDALDDVSSRLSAH